MVEWELLVGLVGIAASVFFGLNGLAKRIATKTDIVAALYAFSKCFKENRTITLDDLKEGYSLAKELLAKK